MLEVTLLVSSRFHIAHVHIDEGDAVNFYTKDSDRRSYWVANMHMYVLVSKYLAWPGHQAQ